MLYKRRTWSIAEVESAEQLAEMLTERTWTLCSGFFVTGHPEILFLNDSTPEDGAAEFAIILQKPGEKTARQLESITFSWISRDRAVVLIRDAIEGRMDDQDFDGELALNIESKEDHGRCYHCA